MGSNVSISSLVVSSNDIATKHFISHEPHIQLTSVSAQIEAMMLLYHLPFPADFAICSHCVVGQSLHDGQTLEWF